MNFQNFKSHIVTHGRKSHYVALFNFEISILKFSFIFWSISDYVTFKLLKVQIYHDHFKDATWVFTENFKTVCHNI